MMWVIQHVLEVTTVHLCTLRAQSLAFVAKNIAKIVPLGGSVMRVSIVI